MVGAVNHGEQRYERNKTSEPGCRGDEMQYVGRQMQILPRSPTPAPACPLHAMVAVRPSADSSRHPPQYCEAVDTPDTPLQ